MTSVVLDGYALNPGDLSWAGLEKLGALTVYDRTPPDKIVERAADAELIFTNKAALNADTLAQLPKLKFICVLATGYNIIDTEAAKKQGIVVSNAPGYATATVVQTVFALLFELTLFVQRHSDAVREGQWSRSADWCFWNHPLIELAGKTIGIVGFGTIGEQVADVAAAFGMNVLATKRHRTDQSHRRNFRWVDTPELLEQADVVTLHCPLTPETTGLINRDNLKRMKPTAFLINTSRGPVVAEQDLADALNNGTIAGAGLDVLSKEPPAADNPLLSANNCLLTPHIGWATKEARTRLMDIIAQNAEAFLTGNPINVVNG